ncbi:proline-rich basic protein 1 [Rhineura floridana]|uniref:proline-rich basic protein 1 n=1 Tax=Rhineura floridana TaxID=261503 RepID=UPI002AC819F9|nr:proline-rich basic protein 1 [Rhineura floridana]
MFSCVTRSGQCSSEPDGLNGEEQFNNYNCRLHSPSLEKDCHISSNSRGDRTSDTSSSYRSALGSEEAESFKDCVEYFEEAGDCTKQCTYCDSEYEQGSITAAQILSAAQTNPADRSKISKVTASHGTLNSFSSILKDDPCSAKGNTYAVTSGGVQADFPLHRCETFGDSLPIQGARAQSLQADRNGTIKDQTCRDKLSSSGKEKQQVQMSIKAKNSPDPVCSDRMGLVTRRLQPGDSGSKYLDNPMQFSSDKSKEMLPNARKLKKSGLGSRAHGPVSSKPACPKYFVENPSVLSDSDEADNEVEKLTALSFQSLSCPQGSYLDMYSSSNRTSSSLSNSLPEDSNGMNRWPSCGDQRKTVVVGYTKGNRLFPTASKAPETGLLAGGLGKEHFECVDVTLENADGKKSLSKKRVVPKRQIQLRRKEKKEVGFCAAGDCAALQPLTQPRKESCMKVRNISDEFRTNYKQFLKAASLSNAYNKTRMASSLVKNVLAKKMQYEQRIKMEQASIQGSSTSSVPSSISTDIQGDSLEGKSSSLSKSDCSFSTEDVQSHSTSERSESIAVNKDGLDALRPTKGVVLNEQLRENVCKLKNTFAELNERMKYQDVTQLKRLPILADGGVNKKESSNIRKQVTGERKEYRTARAVFESQGDTESLAAVPNFAKPQKPWPNLKQRAIRQNKHTQSKEEKFPLKPKSLLVPKDTFRNIFTSKTKEMKLIPQIKNEHNALNAFRHTSLDRVSNNRRLPTFQSMKLSSVIFPASGTSHGGEKSIHPKAPCTEEAIQMESKEKARIHQTRGVRKLVTDTYSLGFKSSDSSSVDQTSYSESKIENSLVVLPRESIAISPLFIHCTSICRKDDAQTANSSQEKKQEQTEDVDVSTLSLHEQGTSSSESPDIFNPPVKTHENVSVCHSESKCSAVGESAVHITTIQSKKLVLENKDFQTQVENKPVPSERSELNVRPSSTTSKKESQLNIKVNSSLSKQSHRTETDYFPASGCSRLDERTMNEAFSMSNHSLLRENKDVASSECIRIPSPTYAQEITKKDNGCATTSRIKGPCKTQEAELPYQKHLSSEILSVAPKDSKVYSSPLKEENMFSESGSPHGRYRHPQAIRPPMSSTQTFLAQTQANNNFADSTSKTTILQNTRPLDNHNRIHSECVILDSPLTTREYIEGIKVISNSPFTPSTSYGKLHDPECDYFNKHQTTNEQYFSATQADNTNYLTIPVKTHQSEATAKHPVPSYMDNTYFTSNISVQPSGEASGNKISNDIFPPKQIERKAPSDNVLYNNPSHGQLPIRLEESPSFTKRNEITPPSGKSASSPTRHFAGAGAGAGAPPPPLQAHRKMLVDPESGKCYYVEPPRQPQLKMLYDPETGQYIEVLIPPVPLSSHSGLYQSPFSPVVMNPGSYGPPYIPYTGFPGFAPPPPAMPPVHLDLQDQQPIQENTNLNKNFNHVPKNDVPPATQTVDGNYMESLYYIPTGMNSSPNPDQALFSPPTSSGPSVPEKGSFIRM